MHTLVYSKCFYLGKCHNCDCRFSNVKVLGQGYKMTNAEQIEKITNAAQCFALLEILKFSAAKGSNFDDKLRQSVFKSTEMKRDIKVKLILKAIN